MVGTRAKDKYKANPPEWINGTGSDVLFTCDENDSSLPPVLIEVQHVVDDNFMRRLLGYCISLEKQYGVLPIVLIFPISSIKFEVLNRIRKRKSHPLLIHYPCHPWAQACFIVDRNGLEENLQQPLIPFASVCLFLVRQDLSLLRSPYNSDQTMQLLYRLAQHHVGTTILDHDHIVDDVLSFCNETKTRLEKILHLQENDHDKNEAISCLKNTLLLVGSYQEKFKQPCIAADSYPELSPSPSPSTTSHTDHPDHPDHTEPSTSAASPPPRLQTQLQKTDANWDFVENCIQKLNGDQISWKAVYQQGKSQGLFTTYSNVASMKRSYYRTKK